VYRAKAFLESRSGRCCRHSRRGRRVDQLLHEIGRASSRRRRCGRRRAAVEQLLNVVRHWLTMVRTARASDLACAWAEEQGSASWLLASSSARPQALEAQAQALQSAPWHKPDPANC
jgi:hypothetical protein